MLARGHYTCRVSSLGSIFESATDEDLPQGEDLKVQVEVPRTGLGRPEGVRVPLASSIEVEGRSVERVTLAGERDVLPLFLPENFSSGSVLRLRGQGGACPGGRPGDLYVTVCVIEPPPAPLLRWWIIVFLFSLISGLVVWAFLRSML